MSDQEDASLEAGDHGARPDEEVRNRRPGRGTQRIDPPKAINLKENHEENFRLFHSQWKQYSILTRLDQEAEEYRVALLLYTIGSDCAKIVETAQLETPTTSAIFDVLQKHCVKDPNVVYQRFVFNSSKQEDEDIDSYAAKLKHLASKCKYGDLKDGLIRDRLVLGVTNAEMRKNCFQHRT